MSGGAPRSPKQVLKNQRDNPGRVTKLEQDPRTAGNYAGNVNSGEREVPALQNEKALRAELQPLKAETDNPWPGAGEDTMQRGKDIA